ncbi:MAG: glycosyl hydrolase family 17 protein, partial [Pseudomonadota bacterium]
MRKLLRFLAGFAVAAVFAAITYWGWAYLNQPQDEAPWPAIIQGFSFAPYQVNQDAILGQLPSEAEIDSDLKLLEGKTHSVRSYQSTGSIGAIPRLAAERKLNVALGIWIDRDPVRNEAEITAGIELTRKYRNVVRVIVGNEAVLRGEVTVDEISKMLDRVRANVRRPVSTAEPWHVWLRYPELADHVDFLAVHMLPFWEGIDVNTAIDYIDDKMLRLREAFPGKKIVIAEVGWPSEGRTRENAVASTQNEAQFLRRFIAQAEKEGYVYYVMEAFDQPWKAQTEGGVGAYWGVYNVLRQPKFVFTEPIVRVPQWQLLAGISVAIAAMVLAVFFANSGTMGTRGRTFMALVVYAVATTSVYIIYDYTRQYVTVTSVVVGTFLIIGMLGVVAVLLAEAHEWAEAHWVSARVRMFSPSADGSFFPKVSIHVPAYNEPPDMLIQTIEAL